MGGLCRSRMVLPPEPYQNIRGTRTHVRIQAGGRGAGGWRVVVGAAVPCTAFNFQMIHQTLRIHEPSFHQCRASPVCGRARRRALICGLPPPLNKKEEDKLRGKGASAASDTRRAEPERVGADVGWLVV